MTTVCCPKCGREFTKLESGSFGSFCPYCAEPYSTTKKTGDGPSGGSLPACSTTESVQHDQDVSPSPREEVRFSFLASLARGLWSWVVLATIITGIITALFSAFGVAVFVEGFFPAAPGAKAVPAVPQLLRTILLFVGIAWLFISIVALPMGLISCLSARRRTIWIENTQICEKRFFGTTRLRLIDVNWSIMPLACDGASFYLPRKLLVVGSQERAIVCGFTNECRAAWETFLRSAGVKQHPRTPLLRPFAISGALFATGILAGTLVGSAIRFIVGNPDWIATGSITGAFDGLLLAIAWMWTQSGNVEQVRNRFHPALVAVACFYVGLAFSLWSAGWAAPVWGAANACFGVAVSVWTIRRVTRRAG